MTPANFIRRTLPWFLITYLTFNLVGVALEMTLPLAMKAKFTPSVFYGIAVLHWSRFLLWVPFLVLIKRIKENDNPLIWVLTFLLLQEIGYLILIGYEITKTISNQSVLTTQEAAPPAS